MLQNLSAEIRGQGGDDAIFDRIAAGHSMRAIAESFGVSRQMVYRWIRSGGGEREAAWQAAKRQSADALTDDALEILDAPGEVTSAEVQRRRDQANFRKWLAGVRDREQYGDGPQVAVTVNAQDLHLDALRQRSALRQQAAATKASEAEAVDGAAKERRLLTARQHPTD